jgi:hypothetical protein
MKSHIQEEQKIQALVKACTREELEGVCLELWFQNRELKEEKQGSTHWLAKKHGGLDLILI